MEYSLAILLLEALGPEHVHFAVKIFTTDRARYAIQIGVLSLTTELP